MQEETIKDLLLKITDNGERKYDMIGTVININDNVCDVRLGTDEEDDLLLDVIINISSISSQKVIPVLGSQVIVSFLSYNKAYVSKFTQISKYTQTTNDAEGQQLLNLRHIFTTFSTDLLTALTNMTLPTPSGPSSPPFNLAEFQNLLNDFDTQLEKYYD